MNSEVTFSIPDIVDEALGIDLKSQKFMVLKIYHQTDDQ